MRVDRYVLDKFQRSGIVECISRIFLSLYLAVRRKTAVAKQHGGPWFSRHLGKLHSLVTQLTALPHHPPARLLHVAEESELHTNVTSAATSSGLAKRFNSDVGRMARKNSRSTAAASVFCSTASSWTNLSTPSDAVGPGSTELTVTFVPAVVSARPRATASCAVLVIP